MHCPAGECPLESWTGEDNRIASARQLLTTRAARSVTIQVGRHDRSVNEVTGEFACAGHTVNDTVVSCGEALLGADDDRIGEVNALGLDGVLMVRLGPYRRQHFSAQIVDVIAGQLLDIVPDPAVPSPWDGWPNKAGSSAAASSSARSTCRAPTDTSSRLRCRRPR